MKNRNEKEKSTPSGVMTRASVPRNSPRLSEGYKSATDACGIMEVDPAVQGHSLGDHQLLQYLLKV